MSAGTPEIPNIITLLHEGPTGALPIVHFLRHYENQIFSIMAAAIVAILLVLVAQNMKRIPGRLQAAIEIAYEGLMGLIASIMGEKYARRYFPFIAALFFFILANNLLGLIPLLKSSTSSYYVTLPLALTVFIYVQWTALTKLGPIKYLDHLAGEPRNLGGFVLAPFLFLLHVISELARPLSLSLRLFGNIFGEDILFGVAGTFGVIILAFLGAYINWHEPPVGLPLQFPFLFLGLLTSFVQALVFTILTTVYFSLALPHEEEHH